MEVECAVTVRFCPYVVMVRFSQSCVAMVGSVVGKWTGLMVMWAPHEGM
jgi:hypothetical protein